MTDKPELTERLERIATTMRLLLEPNLECERVSVSVVAMKAWLTFVTQAATELRALSGGAASVSVPREVYDAAVALVPLLEDGWDEYDLEDDQNEGAKACDRLVDAVKAMLAAAPASPEGRGDNPLYVYVKWVEESAFGYGKAMRVTKSNHPRFIVGSRFDYGFLDIAVMSGYAVFIEPVSDAVKEAMTAPAGAKEGA